MRATTAYRRLRREVHDVLEVGGDAHPMGRVNGFIIVLIHRVRRGYGCRARRAVLLGIRCIQRVLGDRVHRRIRLEDMERRRDPDAEPATALAGKAAAFLPWYLHWLYPLDLRLLRVFRLCRLLMLVRYSPALQTLGRVVADEYRALLGGLLVILILLLFASSGMYLTERHMQPDKVGSIPQAAWWALATMVMSCR